MYSVEPGFYPELHRSLGNTTAGFPTSILQEGIPEGVWNVFWVPDHHIYLKVIVKKPRRNDKKGTGEMQL